MRAAKGGEARVRNLQQRQDGVTWEQGERLRRHVRSTILL